MSSNQYPKHLGGGRYKLSNGDTVKGKSKAKEAEQNLPLHRARKNGNTVAYPLPTDFRDTGLTKRERFAMANWEHHELRSASYIVKEKMNEDRKFDEYVSQDDIEVRMKARVLLADALLKQLEE